MTVRVCLGPATGMRCPSGALTRKTRCVDCARAYDKARGSREERGYGAEHQATRAALLPEAYGTRCPLCGEYMFPHHKLDLDHTEDRSGYRGIVHAHCNRSDGAKRGNALRAASPRVTAGSTARVVLVCGPPCSGKSTHVERHAGPADLVVDYDQIAMELGSPVTHNHSIQYHRAIEAIIEQRCAEVAAGQHKVAWVIRSLPDRQERARWAEWLGAEVIVCDAPDDVLEQRASERADVIRTLEAIRFWRHTDSASSVSHM